MKIKFFKKDVDIPGMLKEAAGKIAGPDEQMVHELAKLRHQVALAEGIITSYREQLANYCIAILDNGESSVYQADLSPEDIANDLIGIFRLESEVFDLDD